MGEPFRRLPQDPAYWEALARRVERAAVTTESAEQWLARRALPLTVGTLAASFVLVLGARTWSANSPVAPSVAWVQALAPSDSLGRAFGATAPPGLGRLLMDR